MKSIFFCTLMIYENRFFPGGPERNGFRGDFQFPFDELDVFESVLGQSLQAFFLAFAHDFAPFFARKLFEARKGFVNRLPFAEEFEFPGRSFEFLSGVLVRNRDFEFFNSPEDVELRVMKSRKAVQPVRVAQQRQVEPSYAAFSSRCRAVFVSLVADGVSELFFSAEQFGRERPSADASSVSFNNAFDFVDYLGAHSSADARSSRNRLRGRDERIRAEA